MELCLFFMPQCMPYDPYPALPYLSGFLRNRNVDVEQFDANNGFYQYLFKKENLEKIIELINTDFLILKNKKILNKIEKQKYNNYMKIKVFASDILDRIETAIRIMKSKTAFYDPARYYWASNTISAALFLYSSYFYPEKISVSDYKFIRDVKTISDVLTLVEDNYNSIYTGYLNEVLLPYLLKEKPKIIGFSMFDFSQFYSSLLLTKLIRECLDYKPQIVFGGILMSFMESKICRTPKLFEYIDAVLLYEGEISLYNYVKYTQGQEKIENVCNLLYTKNGKIYKTNIGKFDLNSISMPDYNGINMDHYFSPEKIISVISSKGCHWAKCTFCTQHLISGKGVYVEKDIDKLINEITELKKTYKTSFFWFNDTSIKADRLRLIAEKLIEAHCNIVWRCETRLDSKLSDEIIEKLSKAGCRKIGFGMESGSQKILKNIRKGITLQEAERIIKKCYECGIAVQLYFIVGFPGEKIEDIKETLNFVIQNRKYISTFGFSELILEEGSEYQINPALYGITEMKCSNELRREYQFKASGISQNAAHEIVNKLVNYYAKELGEKPFWGDEVESHHLFYLQYYKDPKLNNAKIHKKNLCILGNHAIMLKNEFIVEKIWDDDLENKAEKIFLINSDRYKVYEVDITLFPILKKLEHRVSTKEIKMMFPESDVEELLDFLNRYELLEITEI